MERLKWSDNLGTVGWTCIHALMTPDDMRELASEHPKGNFTATFYVAPEDGGMPRTAEAFEALQQKQQSKQRLPVCKWGGFYFNFPMDERGKALLRRHGLKTCPCCDGTGWASDPGIGEACYECGGQG